MEEGRRKTRRGQGEQEDERGEEVKVTYGRCEGADAFMQS